MLARRRRLQLPERLHLLHTGWSRPDRAPAPRRARGRRPLPRRQHAFARSCSATCAASCCSRARRPGSRSLRVPARHRQGAGHGLWPRGEAPGRADGVAPARLGHAEQPGDATDALAVALCDAHLCCSPSPAPPARDRRCALRELARAAPVIAQLRGRLLRKAPGEVVLDVGGVGYRVVDPGLDLLSAGRASATRPVC